MTKITEEYIEEEITRHYNTLAKTDTSSLKELIGHARLKTYILGGIVSRQLQGSDITVRAICRDYAKGVGVSSSAIQQYLYAYMACKRLGEGFKLYEAVGYTGVRDLNKCLRRGEAIQTLLGVAYSPRGASILKFMSMKFKEPEATISYLRFAVTGSQKEAILTALSFFEGSHQGERLMNMTRDYLKRMTDGKD